MCKKVTLIMNSKTPDIIFECKKCGHNVFVTEKGKKHWFKRIMVECPECGEEPYSNWIITGMGDFDKHN